MICSVTECSNKSVSRSFCNMHYLRFKAHGHPLSKMSTGRKNVKSIATVDRFLRHVSPEPNSGCWLWLGGLRGGGYGQFNPSKGVGKTAHRWMYEFEKGPVPKGLDLDHKCRVRSCVNPDHLEPVTRSVNCKRGLSGHHRKNMTHCKHGHLFTDESTYHIPGTNWRACAICRKIRSKK